MKTEKKETLNKTDNLIREILIYPMAVIWFPLMTIRVLVWKWNFWLQAEDEMINVFHKQINNI